MPVNKHARRLEVKRHVGRQMYVPTEGQRKLVELKAAAKYSHRFIASLLEIDEKTLRKHYRDELANGGQNYIAKVKERVLVEALTSKNPTDKYYVLNNEYKFLDPAVIEAPKLTLFGENAFADGGPGRKRRVPFDFEAEVAATRAIPAGADRLGDSGDPPPEPTEIPMSPQQTLLPKPEAPKKSAIIAQYETLGLSPEQFRAAQPKALEPIICIGRATCPCPRCLNARAGYRHSHESSERSQ